MEYPFTIYRFGGELKTICMLKTHFLYYRAFQADSCIPHFKGPNRNGNFQAACCLNIWLCPLVSFVSLVCQKKICVSVRWVTLWVRPPPVKICVSVRWVTLWVRPPLVCVLSLDPCMLPTPLCSIFIYGRGAKIWPFYCLKSGSGGRTIGQEQLTQGRFQSIQARHMYLTYSETSCTHGSVEF